MFNTKNYLTRIHFADEIKLDLPCLRNLQKQHLLNIPFENLDIDLGKEISLDINKIYNKIIHSNRGGFCYELNGLFNQLLTELGFKTQIISIRVHKQDDIYSEEFDHLAILVTLDDEVFLTDVGFGEFITYPLKLTLDKIQIDEGVKYIFERFVNGYIRLSRLEAGEAKPVSIFKPQPREISNFSAMCNFHQTNYQSHFTKGKIISKLTEQGRISFSTNKISITEGDILTEKPIEPHQFDDLLFKHFNIKL